MGERKSKRSRSSSSDSSSSSSSSSSNSSSSSSSSSKSGRSSSEGSVKKVKTDPIAKGVWVEGDFVFDLEKDKKEVSKIKVHKFKDNLYIDIRKYYDNGTKPTAKGISLKPELFEKLKNLSPVIYEAVELIEKKRDSLSPHFQQKATVMRDDKEITVSLELDKYNIVRVSKFKKLMLIDIRNFYNGGPTKKGISLAPEIFRKIADWSEWKEALVKLR